MQIGGIGKPGGLPRAGAFNLFQNGGTKESKVPLAGAAPGGQDQLTLSLSYLEEQAAGRADEFAIPFTRAELADYLCVERSAMSTVLSRLRAEGLVETRGRRFRLHTHPH